MGSNYPPGVTGSEYEIAGPDYEDVEQKVCGAEGVKLITISEAGRAAAVLVGIELRRLAANLELTPESIRSEILRVQLAAAGIDAEEAEVERCPFEGGVDVQGYRGQKWWTCPVCRTEHEEEADGYGG